MARANINTPRWKKLKEIWFSDWSTAYTVAVAHAYLADIPDEGLAWYILGQELTSIARYREAKSAFRRAIQFSPKKYLWKPLSNMGHLYVEAGDFESAKQWYRRTIKAAPNNASGYIYLGGLLSQQGRFKQAEKILRQAIKCPDGCIDEAFLNLGFNLRAQGRLKESLVCFKRTLAINPKDSNAKQSIRDVRATLRFQRAKVTPTKPTRR